MITTAKICSAVRARGERPLAPRSARRSVQRVVGSARAGLAVAAPVEPDHPAAAGQRLERAGPHPPVGDAGMAKHDRRSRPRLVVREPDPVHLGERHRCLLAPPTAAILPGGTDACPAAPRA